MEAEEDGVIQRSETGFSGMKRQMTGEDTEGGCDNKRIKTDVCKCADAVKVKAIEEVLENSKDVNSNLLILKVKHILKPLKYSEEYFEEDVTKIKLEPVSVKTEPFLKDEHDIKQKQSSSKKLKINPDEPKDLFCDICKVEFNEITKKEKHMAVLHKSQMTKVEKKSVPTKAKEPNIKPKEFHPCSSCQERFDSKNKLKKHLQIIHPKRPAKSKMQ